MGYVMQAMGYVTQAMGYVMQAMGYVMQAMGYVILRCTCQNKHMHLIIIISSVRYQAHTQSVSNSPKGHALLKHLQYVDCSERVFGSN